jgi:pimeloyl-ACP methyl ester carboxylesterase
MIGHMYGSGPTRVLVLPGWLGDWSVFEPVLPGLDGDRFTFAFLDVRGYGAAKAMPGPFTMETVAADALAQADQLGWQRFSVIGHSMGGKAALRLAVSAPDRVQSIIGVTPVWAGAAPFDSDTLGFFRGAVSDVSIRAAILDNTTGERLPKAWSRTQAAASRAVSTEAAFAGYLESWALDDFAQAAGQLEQPVLVVVGAHDAGVTETVVRATWLKALSGARLERLAEAGHYPMIETPLLLAGLIERFLISGGEPAAGQRGASKKRWWPAR